MKTSEELPLDINYAKVADWLVGDGDLVDYSFLFVQPTYEQSNGCLSHVMQLSHASSSFVHNNRASALSNMCDAKSTQESSATFSRRLNGFLTGVV